MAKSSVTAARRGRKPRRDRSDEIAEGLFETTRPRGLHERIHRSLVHAITSGRYEKGARLPSEPELATAFAVSRPVVRQALDRLRRDGLVKSLRGSGNYVVGIDELIAARLLSASGSLLQTQLMLDDLEFRLVIEPESAFFAARRRGLADMDRIEMALRKLTRMPPAPSPITSTISFMKPLLSRRRMSISYRRFVRLNIDLTMSAF